MHGVAEISAAAIVWGTGAGLCAGPRLSPAAKLCTGLRLSPATELCAALGWSRNATTMTQRSRFIAKSGIYGRYRVLTALTGAAAVCHAASRDASDWPAGALAGLAERYKQAW